MADLFQLVFGGRTDSYVNVAVEDIRKMAHSLPAIQRSEANQFLNTSLSDMPNTEYISFHRNQLAR